MMNLLDDDVGIGSATLLLRIGAAVLAVEIKIEIALVKRRRPSTVKGRRLRGGR